MSAETYAEVFEYGGLKGRFASIDYVDALGGYEWDEFHVLRGADGYLYVGADSGCSCNDFTGTNTEFFERVASWQEAANKATAWALDAESWSSERRQPVALNLIERLAHKRPAPFIDVDARDPFRSAS